MDRRDGLDAVANRKSHHCPYQNLNLCRLARSLVSILAKPNQVFKPNSVQTHILISVQA